jgi:restriction system protein
MSTSPSKAVAIKALYATFSILKENGGQLASRQILEEIPRRVELTDWDKSILEKSGYIRWQSILHFYTVDASKAGYLLKKDGTWYLTPEGEKAMALGPEKMFETANKAYRAWRAANPKTTASTGDDAVAPEDSNEKQAEATIEDVRARATEGIKEYVNSKNPYEFQDLCAALLRGMGYHTPFVAPKGRDGGIDVIAYRDPLGTTSPRIRVQVKHREQSASPAEVQQLVGVLRHDGDVGIFFSSGGFTSAAEAASRNSRVHIELIDLDRFIRLWQEFYSKMSDADKGLLPLTPIYFLAPSE